MKIGIWVLPGVAGAAVSSQASSFTLQYLQNLQGRVDALRKIVESFDANLQVSGYSHERALNECFGATELLGAFCKTFVPIVERYDFLSLHLSSLEAASGFLRPFALISAEIRGFFGDFAPGLSEIQDVIASTYKQYVWTWPMTTDSLAFTAAGFLAFPLITAIFLKFCGTVLGVRRPA